MISILILSILLALGSDIYIWLSMVRAETSLFWNIVYWLPSSVLIATVIVAFTGNITNGLIRLFSWLILCIVFPKLLFAVFSVAGCGLELAVPRAAHIMNVLGIIVAAVVCLTSVYGLSFGWKRLKIKQTDMIFDNLPEAFDGYRIVQFSDMHIGTFGKNGSFIEKLVEKINSLHPDLIVFTGDMVNLSSEEMDPYLDVLKELEAKDGILSILGNHDYCLYKRYDKPLGAERNLEELILKEQSLGWNLLRNDFTTIERKGEGIVVIGVENDSEPPFPSKGDLSKAMRNVPKDAFKILLSHDPTHWHREVVPTTDIELTLSGHTHAMQLKIGNYSPASIVYPEWGGRYNAGKQTLYVSTGAGGNIPFRLGAWPQIDVLTLHRSL